MDVRRLNRQSSFEGMRSSEGQSFSPGESCTMTDVSLTSAAISDGLSGTVT